MAEIVSPKNEKTAKNCGIEIRHHHRSSPVGNDWLASPQQHLAMKTSKRGFTLIEICITVVVAAVILGVVFAAKKGFDAGAAVIGTHNASLSNAMQRAIQRVGSPIWIVEYPATNGIYTLTDEQMWDIVTNVHSFRIDGKTNGVWRTLTYEPVVGTTKAITELVLGLASLEGKSNPQTKMATWRIVPLN